MDFMKYVMAHVRRKVFLLRDIFFKKVEMKSIKVKV